MGAKAICSILASVAVAVVDSVGRVRGYTSRIRISVEAISLQLASVTVADDTSGIWARHGERRVQILEMSIGVLVHGPCSCLWYPDVMARPIWEGDAVIVSGAGKEGTSGQLGRAWIPEGSKDVIPGMSDNPWIRIGMITRCSKRIRSTTAEITVDMVGIIILRKRQWLQIGEVTKGVVIGNF